MWLIRLLPIGLLRWIAALQFRLPIVGPWLGWINRKLLAKEGTISHGHGAGLRFDAQGGFAGYLLGTSEPEEQEALFKLLKRGDVVYDLGANVGFFSVLAARFVGPEGKVYAFEPLPACVEKIKKNAALNGFTQIEAIEAAVSSKVGSAQLYVSGVSAHSSLIDATNRRDSDTIEIALTTVDEFLRIGERRPPNLVMIDVEGAEIEALRGMHETLEQYRPTVMVEIHFIGDEFLAYCREQLLPLGYRVEMLGGGEFPPSASHYHALLLPQGVASPTIACRR